jgi:hypothetical protein
MKSKRFSPVFVLITCVLLLATVSWGQNEGAIVQGQLVTGSGAPVVNALIRCLQ